MSEGGKPAKFLMMGPGYRVEGETMEEIIKQLSERGMSELPKCTSWRGHRFEGRYSFVTPGSINLGPFRGRADQYEQMIRSMQDKTYERDICVRCGITIERNRAPETDKTQA